MEFNYSNVLIYGYGDSGRAVEEVLKSIGVNYKIYDKKIKIGGGCFVLNLSRTLKDFDLIVLSPGVSIYDKYVRRAIKRGIKVISELEFGYMFVNCKLIGVTGTNGKTSTVTLISNILSDAGYSVGTYGNIGVPLSSAYSKSYDYIVCEISSFQLECIDRFKCDISVILNIDADHLDRHKTLKNYICAKLNIAKNNNADSQVVLNADDTTCMQYKDKVKGKQVYVSRCSVVEGVYCKDGTMYYNNGIGISELFELDKLKHVLPYIDNVMCAVAVSKLIGVQTSTILKTIKKWRVMSHRLEFVTKSNGVSYIDDSKSTNVHSVVRAIDSVNGNIILMLGGANKKLKFNELIASLPKNIKSVVAFGDSANYIYKLCKRYNVNVQKAVNVRDAVNCAKLLAVQGDTILFSPGCTSFDAYSSYAERGDDFKNIVKELTSNEKD